MKLPKNSIDIEDDLNRAKTMIDGAERVESFIHDGRDYYKNYEEERTGSLIEEKKGGPSSRDSQMIYFNDNLVGECYLGFSKLLQSELRKYEKRDSTILSNRMSRMSNRVSTMFQGNS